MVQINPAPSNYGAPNCRGVAVVIVIVNFIVESRLVFLIEWVPPIVRDAIGRGRQTKYFFKAQIMFEKALQPVFLLVILYLLVSSLPPVEARSRLSAVIDTNGTVIGAKPLFGVSEFWAKAKLDNRMQKCGALLKVIARLISRGSREPAKCSHQTRMGGTYSLVKSQNW